MGKDRSVELHHNRGRENQMFGLVSVSAEKMIFAITEHVRSSTIVYKDNVLTSDLVEENDPKGRWIFKRANKNKYLS